MTKVVNIKNTKNYDVFIGRGGNYGNPFDYQRLGITRKECIDLYREWFYKKLSDVKFRDSILALKDKTLGCYCKPLDCHGDVIVEYVENYEKTKSLHSD